MSMRYVPKHHSRSETNDQENTGLNSRRRTKFLEGLFEFIHGWDANSRVG